MITRQGKGHEDHLLLLIGLEVSISTFSPKYEELSDEPRDKHPSKRRDLFFQFLNGNQQIGNYFIINYNYSINIKKAQDLGVSVCASRYLELKIVKIFLRDSIQTIYLQ